MHSLFRYFRTVEPSRDAELPLTGFEYLSHQQSLGEQVVPQFNVIPVKKLRLALISRSGFVKIPGTMFKNKDRVYKPAKAVMYAPWDIEHLRKLGSTPFKEAVKGCRWDADCDDSTPTVRVWDKGAEPGNVPKKEALPAAPYLKAADVEKALKPAASYAVWDKRRLLEIRPDSRLSVFAVQTDSEHPTALHEHFPSLDEILRRLAWVTSSTGTFDPAERPVHLCVYMGACAGEAAYDARARDQPAKAAFALMRGLLRFDGSLGIAILPGNTPVSWVPPELAVVAQRFIVFQDKNVSGCF